MDACESREPFPWTDEIWHDWLTLPYMTTLVGIDLRGWSGHIRDLSYLKVSFLFFFFCFLRQSPGSHFLIYLNSLCRNACLAEDLPFGGVVNKMSNFFVGNPPPLRKTSSNGRECGFSSLNDISSYLSKVRQLLTNAIFPSSAIYIDIAYFM